MTARRFHLQILLSVCILYQAAGAANDAFREGGDAYKRGDYARAAEKFLEVAEKGDHRAMYALGSMYAVGNGVEQDYRQAFKWFTSAARYNRPDAQYKLGLMYDEGIGVKRNYNQAARWYDRSAKQAYADAQFRLGMLYALGHGVGQNDVRAYAWLKVAEQNYLGKAAASGGSEVRQETAAEQETAQAGAAQPPADVFAAVHMGVIADALRDISARITPEQMQEAGRLQQDLMKYR